MGKSNLLKQKTMHLHRGCVWATIIFAIYLRVGLKSALFMFSKLHETERAT